MRISDWSSDVCSSDLKEKSTIIQDNAKRLLRLFQELLDFRKIEDNEVELSIKEVDIVPVIENIARQFNEITEQKGIRFIAELPESMLTGTDTSKLEKIILNLLSNSFKHTSHGDLIKLELKEPRNHFIEIELSDTGEGIDDAHLPYILDRYNSFEHPDNSHKSFTSIAIGISEEHTSEPQSLMRISYAVFCLKKKKKNISHRYVTN